MLITKNLNALTRLLVEPIGNLQILNVGKIFKLKIISKKREEREGRPQILAINTSDADLRGEGLGVARA